MIDNVYGGDEYLLVNSSTTGYVPYISPTQPMSGMVRFNNNRMEVYDGTSWHQVSGGSAHINLSSDAKDILNWAKNKMREEQEQRMLGREFAGVAEALELMRIARENLDREIQFAHEKLKVVEILST